MYGSVEMATHRHTSARASQLRWNPDDARIYPIAIVFQLTDELPSRRFLKTTIVPQIVKAGAWARRWPPIVWANLAPLGDCRRSEVRHLSRYGSRDPISPRVREVRRAGSRFAFRLQLGPSQPTVLPMVFPRTIAATGACLWKPIVSTTCCRCKLRRCVRRTAS